MLLADSDFHGVSNGQTELGVVLPQFTGIKQLMLLCMLDPGQAATHYLDRQLDGRVESFNI